MVALLQSSITVLVLVEDTPQPYCYLDVNVLQYQFLPLFSRKSGWARMIMAQASPKKLPRGKAESYSVVALSDQKLVVPLLSGLSFATCNPSVETDVKPEPVPQVYEGTVLL